MRVPRVVVDSNVLISAFGFKGKPDEVLRAARKGEVELYLSPFILEEARKILTREKFSFDETAVEEFLAMVPYHEVDPGQPRLAVSRDPKDNPVLECAVAAKAHSLITGDRDLLDLERHEDIIILGPADFLRRHNEATLKEAIIEGLESGKPISGEKVFDELKKRARAKVSSKKRQPRKR